MITLTHVIRTQNLRRMLISVNSKKSIHCSTSHYSNLDSVNLAYSMYDSAPLKPGVSKGNPVIIMHGLFGSKQNWKSMSKLINLKSQPQRKVVAVDARNHGESTHSPNHTYEHLADDVATFMKNLQIPKSVVIGHSMGGRAMMTFALKYPDLVEKAIIVDISPVTDSPALTSMGAIFEAMCGVYVSPDQNISSGRKSADEQLQSSISDKATRDFILMNLRKSPDDGSFSWVVNVKALHTNFKNHIAVFPQHLTSSTFSGPMLFIGGSQSDYIRSSELPRIKKIFPNSQLDFIDAGHLVHVEKPQELSQKILNFINSS